MKRVVTAGPNQWAIEEADPVAPGRGEVMVHPVSAGICGGDMDLLAGQNAVAQYPLVLGHECVAVVAEAGPSVDLEPGDYVAIYPTVSCGECRACQAGWNNQCPDMRTLGLAHPNGCFTQSLTLPSRNCIPIPAEVALRYGALVEPTAVACHVTSRAGIEGGESTLVIGVGPIGTAVGVVALERGAASVVGVDRFESREATARHLGFADFSTEGGDGLREWLKEEVGPLDIVFDTVGSDETTAISLEGLRPGGRYLAVASSKPGQKLTLPYPELFLKELEMIASRNYRPTDFEEAAALLIGTTPDLDRLVTARYPLEDFGQAVASLRDDPMHQVKVILEPGGLG